MAGRGGGGRPPAGRRGRDRILRPGAGGGHVPRAAARRRAARAGAGLGRAPAPGPPGALGLAARPTVRRRGAAEIGRASCRERGEISVVAGSLKKKKKKKLVERGECVPHETSEM